MPLSNDLALLTIEQLFSADSHYVIPIYQRNYAWARRRLNSLFGTLPMLLKPLKMQSNRKTRNTIWAAWWYMSEMALIAHTKA